MGNDLGIRVALPTIVWKRPLPLQSGARVIADAVPSMEYDKTMNKATAMLNAMEIAEKGF